MVERNCDFAAALAETCADLDGVQVVATVSLNQLLLRFADSDDATRATIENIQRRGCMFVGPALWHGDWVMRISVCNFETGPAILPDVVTEIAAAWQEVRQVLYKTPMANGGSSHDR